MKITLTPDALRPKAKQPSRLPGEPRPFKERSSLRNLVPAQHLDANGKVTSGRDHEVQRTDPLLLRIKELEDAVKYWKAAYEHVLKESLK